MIRLTFVEAGETFSTYRDPNGEPVYLAHGVGFRRLTPFDDLDLGVSWRAYVRQFGHNADDWLDTLRDITTDPDAVDYIVWCLDCNTPIHEEDPNCTDIGDGQLCNSCISAWSRCDRCDAYVREATTTLDDNDVCDSCRRDDYSWCEGCDGWYLDSEADEHDHDRGCRCESPEQTFTVRNDGEESGMSTAQHFQPGKQYDWMIEFDRGGTDVVMYDYDDPEVREMVREAGADVGQGIFSDICYLEHLGIKGFNWGVGYRDYHYPRAHAYLDDTFSMVAKYLRFHERNEGTTMPHFPTPHFPTSSLWDELLTLGADPERD